MSTGIAADPRWTVAAAENAVRADSQDSQHSERRAGGHARHTIGGLLDDAVMLLLVIWLFPVAILLIGMPVVLLVRVLLEIAKRM